MKPLLADNKAKLFLGLALVALAVILLLPAPARMFTDDGQAIELTGSGKATLGVLALAVILWVSEAVPFAITGLIAMVALVMTGAADLKTLTEDGFGNRIVLFFIGVLTLSAAITQVGLLPRLTNWLLYKLGHRPKTIILVFLFIGAMLSAWITDMAVAAVLLPIGVAILRDANLKPLESNFGRALMIACCWGPLIGGVATPAGCGPNPLTMQFLRELGGVDFTFTDWMIIGYPATFLMLLPAWGILLLVFPIEKVNLTMAHEDFRKKLKAMGPLHRKEILTILIFALTVFLWVAAPAIKSWTGGAVDYLSIHFVAIACACLFFVPGIEVLNWKQAQEKISWGGIVLIASGLSLGMATYKTGAAEWIAWVAFHQVGLLSPFMIVFVIVLGVSLMKVMFSSNTVTGTIMVPLLIALAGALEIEPTLLAIPAGITSSLAFILVTSTPTNVIPYSAGYFTIKDMAKAGLLMTVASSICVTVSICIFGRLFNIVTW